ncbi:SRPBCC family protein [Pseudokineococcus lusitanus]|uniref:Polyketide cyclase/dehydrase/lipid transport protein n=1 Tax=Pseudokineococcus lusitanus TaxID=763993 RepID=A0A3N1HTM3_9ACTN|nr:SRPBCC family protein [Pseudokineococcus lusitanus]ROP45874.1 polyketide cyclase/dehydrase/lipid transport protein [Pseudokineococcus lusitanus]
MSATALTLRVAARGGATPDLAWERYARPALWPTWSPQITGVELPDRLTTGARGVVHGVGGLRLDVVVLDVDEATRTWAWEVTLARPRVPGVRMRLDHAVLPGRAGGARTTLALTGPAPVVTAYAPAAWVALRGLVRP